MFWFWFSVIGILILTGLAFYWAVRVRRQRLERKLRLKISNLGNVESHIQLRAEELSGQLEFLFSYGGSQLPEVVEAITAAPLAELPVSGQSQAAQASSPGTGGELSRKAEKTMSLSYSLASMLTSVGTILPGRLGSPFLRAGSHLSRGQAQVSRVQQVGYQASRYVPAAHSKAASTPAVSPRPQAAFEGIQGKVWVETPEIPPGESLGVDLLVRSAWVAGDVMRSFQIKSRSTEGTQARMNLEDGQVEIRGGFWSHRVLPHLLILTVAILALLLAIWIARWNGLPV